MTKYIKWVGIIAIITERTQIHFLSDILVAVPVTGTISNDDGDGNENSKNAIGLS